MLQLGLHTASLGDLSFEEVVDYASQIGFCGLELCCWPKGQSERKYAGITNIDVDTIDKSKAAYLQEYAAKKGVSIASLGYFPNALSDDPLIAEKSQQHIIKVIDASALLNVRLVTTFIGKNKLKTIEENIELMKTIWAPIMRHAEEKEVRVAIENCPMYFTKNEWPGGNNLATTPQVWREMLSISPNIGLCFDPSHTLLLGINTIKPIIDFGSRIFHVHLKDMQIDQDKADEYGRFSYPSLWHTPKLPGLGDVNFPKVIAKLNEAGFNGFACLECEDRTFEGTKSDVRRGIEQAYRYLKTIM